MTRKKLQTWGWCALAASAVLAAYLFAYDLPRRKALYGPRAREADGVVAGKCTGGGLRAKTYYAMVQLPDEGGRARVVNVRYGWREWRALARGQRVRVRYHPAQPGLVVDVRSSYARRPDPLRAALLVTACAAPGAAALLLARRPSG